MPLEATGGGGGGDASVHPFDGCGNIQTAGEGQCVTKVLEEKVIQRVGGSEGIPVDVRIVAATNVNMFEAIKKDTSWASRLYIAR